MLFLILSAVFPAFAQKKRGTTAAKKPQPAAAVETLAPETNQAMAAAWNSGQLPAPLALPAGNADEIMAMLAQNGANLAENGGNAETVTEVQIRLTGKRDRTDDATNVYWGQVTGQQQLVDYEYDKYKIDEGYCGRNAVYYKGPKEITRTSTTTAAYNKETRVYVNIDRTSGSINFSLPEINGTPVHKYVHKSPCAEHDRVNTNEAINEDVATTGGSFSFSFPIDASQKSVKGALFVREEDGGTTTYTWELSRN